MRFKGPDRWKNFKRAAVFVRAFNTRIEAGISLRFCSNSLAAGFLVCSATPTVSIDLRPMLTYICKKRVWYRSTRVCFQRCVCVCVCDSFLERLVFDRDIQQCFHHEILKDIIVILNCITRIINYYRVIKKH